MFDFAWSEIALIGVVALVAIGPKDLPVAIKTVADLVKKARKMAGEFQTHVDEMVREANLGEVRDQFNDLRRMDIKGKILDAVDGDKTIRKTIADNPLAMTGSEIKPPPPPVPVHDSVAAEPAYTPALSGVADLGVPGLTETTVALRAEHAVAGPIAAAAPDEVPAEAAALAFLPPAVVKAGPPGSRPLPPAFVPPAAVAASAARSAYASPYA